MPHRFDRVPRLAVLGLVDRRSVLIDAPFSSVVEVMRQAWCEGATICLPVAGKLFEPFRAVDVLVVAEAPAVRVGFVLQPVAEPVGSGPVLGLAA